MQQLWEGVRDLYCAISQTGQSTALRKYVASNKNSTILEDFGKILDRQAKTGQDRQFTRAISDQYSVKGSSQQKYWTSESFHRHIRHTTSSITISDPEIQVLWRSFCYYAHHPVPTTSLELDFSAFQRIINLLVFQCDNLLISQELDDWRGEAEHQWRYDESGFNSPAIESQYRTARIARLFRSIGTPKPNADVNGNGNQTQIEDVLTDAMDILALCGPEFLHSRPTAEQWKALAQKLYPHGVVYRDMRRDDVFMLVNMLLRLNLKDEKRRSGTKRYNYGEIVEGNLAYTQFANSLVDRLTGKESTTAEMAFRSRELMPDLNARFYQLWAVLFQPPVLTTQCRPFSRSDE